jgi:chromosome segregation ATPase
MVSVPVPAGESVDMPLTMQKKISRSEQLQSDACVRAVDAAIAQNLLPQELASDLKKFTESQKRLSDINMRYNQLNSQSWDIKRDQQSISDTLLGLKNIKSKTADSLRNQLIERQKSNDKKLEEIMTQMYELTVEKSELEMTLKTLNRTLQYTRS